MLTTLLESRSHHAGATSGTAASVVVHAAIIFTAVYATAAGAPVKEKPVNPPPIIWVPVPAPQSVTNTALPNRGRSNTVPVPIPNPLVVPIVIPTSVPPFNLPVPPVTLSELVGDISGNRRMPDHVAPGNPSFGGRGAYDSSEVEVAAALIGNTVPEYPSGLRASNIEGKVFAEFVVNDLGRAGSLRIISSTNEGFVESIRRALPRMRFRPARMGGHPVPQLVQQQFVFKLDH